MSDVRAENIQSQLAELFSRLLTTDGPEAFESEAAKAIAGLSAMIYQARGPERLEAVLVGVPEAVERFLAGRLKRFNYRVIPAGDEPISIGAAMMQDRPDEQELKRIIEPHLGRFTMIRMKVLVDGEPRDMFVDALAVPKDLPRNERATAIYREHLLTKHPHLDSESLPYMAGTAVLFEEPVWFD